MAEELKGTDSEFTLNSDSPRFPFPKRLPPGQFPVARAEWSSGPANSRMDVYKCWIGRKQGRAFLWMMDPAAWEYDEKSFFQPYCSVPIGEADDGKTCALTCLRFGWSWERNAWQTPRPSIYFRGEISQRELESLADSIWHDKGS